MYQITPILRHQPGEVMINFMYDFINRFINYPDRANERSLDRFFGTARWREIRNANDREAASVDLYKEQLRTTGKFPFVTSTRILKPRHDRAYFHLVYATRNPKGIPKFRDVEKQTTKEQEDVRATAQREHREQRSGQTELTFEPSEELSTGMQAEREQRLQEALTLLFTLLQKGPISYGDLQPRVLEIPLVWNTDLNAMLLHEHNERRLIIQGLEPRQRAPNSGNIIKLP